MESKCLSNKINYHLQQHEMNQSGIDITIVNTLDNRIKFSKKTTVQHAVKEMIVAR